MTDINVSVYVNGVDKFEHVISYERSQDICNSVGKFDVIFDHAVTDFVDLDPYNEIILYEDGVKKGTYYLLEKTQDASTGNYTLACQDKSKRLIDYWITSSYSVKSRITTRYWIEKFLNEAGIDYEFDLEDEDDYGAYVNNDTVFGRSSAYDLIIQLLQMSSWYLYFNADGTAIIGKFIRDTDNYTVAVDDTSIINLRTTKNDKMIRNRVVVWGKADPYNRGWVFADIYKPTPWDYDENDKRTLVVSNGYIENVTAAYSLASKAIKEFSKITYEKELNLTGSQNIKLGDVILVGSSYYSGSGLVTHVGSKMNANEGLTTNVILDQRCPRIYAYYSFGNPVYIGTTEDGVWKKPLKYHVWSDYNTGLPINDRHIVDLAANAGTLVCVTVNGNAYMRTPMTTGWNKIVIEDNECFGDKSYTTEDLTAVCCDINKATCEVYIGYKCQPDVSEHPDRWQSFIITATAYNKYIVSLIRDSIGNKYYQIFDLTCNEKELIISAYGETSAIGLLYCCEIPGGGFSYFGNTFINSNYTNAMPEQQTLILKEISSSISTLGEDIATDGEYVYYYFNLGLDYYAVRKKLSDDSYISIKISDTIKPYTKTPILDKEHRLLLFGFTTPFISPSYWGFAVVDFDVQTVTLVGADYPLSIIFAGYEEPDSSSSTAYMSPVTIQTKENEFVALIYNTYTVMGFFINLETTATSFYPIIITSKLSVEEGTIRVSWYLSANTITDRNKLIVTFARSAQYFGPGG